MSSKANEQAIAVRKYVIDHQREIELALPRHIQLARFMRVSFTVMSQNPKLYTCDRRSLLGALVQVAQLGLEPGVMGQAYIVPFVNRKRNTTEAQLIAGYRGLLTLARRSGDISTVHAWPAYEGDHFRVILGTEPKIEHVPSDQPIAWVEDLGKGDKRWRRRPMIAVYAVARMRDGGVQFDAMRRDECEWHRDRYSRSAGDGPWVTDFEEMSKKTVLRRLSKLLPASVELQTAVALDEMAEVGVAQDLAHLIGGSGPEEPEPPKESKLDRLVRGFREPEESAPTPPAPETPAEPEPSAATEPDPLDPRQLTIMDSERREEGRAMPAAVTETSMALKRSIIMQQRAKLKFTDDEFNEVCRQVVQKPFAAITASVELDGLHAKLAAMLQAKVKKT